MRAADEIKQLLSMRQVAEFYGFQVGRSGFMVCPFHQGDHQASLKLYDGDRGFHCFGCGANGSVIDFVMKLFGLNFRQGCLRPNADFQLGLSNEKPDLAVRSKLLEARRRERREKDAREAEYWRRLSELRYWQEVIQVFRPAADGERAYYHPLYVEAVKRLPYIEYWLDDFLEKGGDTV